MTHGVTEALFVQVGDEMIWESEAEKLLGVTVDKKINFKAHLSNICKKAINKVTALARVARILLFHERLILKSFIESQFSYCPLVWMFCTRKMNRKMNHIHERALRLVYNDYTSTFAELLKEDNSISFHCQNIHRLAIEMYKVKKNLCPPFVEEIFTYNESIDKFLRPNVRTVKMGDGSLRSFGPVVWNTMVPDRIKSSPNINIFKNSIKSWVPDNCKCRLCKDYVPQLGYVNITE